MLACQGLTWSVPGAGGRERVLDGVTLAVGAGEIVAVVGAPAHGPGLLLRALAGLAPVARRMVVHDRPAGQRAPAGFGYLRAGHAGPPDLSPVEWLRYVADHHGGPVRGRAVRVQAALSLVGLGPADAGRRMGVLDRDAMERVAVATGAVSGAPVLFFDACLAGVSAGARRVLAEALRDLAGQGRTLLLAPSDVRAVEDIATRVLVLRDGRVLADLRMMALQEARVAELWLNGGALSAIARLQAHFPDAVRTGTGMEIPLTRGRSLEAVLAVCYRERIAVQGSRVRYRAVDDYLGARSAPDPARAAPL